MEAAILDNLVAIIHIIDIMPGITVAGRRSVLILGIDLLVIGGGTGESGCGSIIGVTEFVTSIRIAQDGPSGT